MTMPSKNISRQAHLEALDCGFFFFFVFLFGFDLSSIGFSFACFFFLKAIVPLDFIKKGAFA